MGEDEYQRQGRPLFGKLWSYEELQGVGKLRKGKPQALIEKPASWPEDTEVDNDHRWAFWLPEGWMQGIRTSTTGKTLRCWFAPDGRRFWHKKDAEKYIGYALPSRDDQEQTTVGPAGDTKTCRYVTDAGAIPSWPSDGEWLPSDWKVGFRQLPSGLHRIYVPAGRTDGFLYNKSNVLDYLSGKNTNVCPWESSRPMNDITGGNPVKKARPTTEQGAIVNKKASVRKSAQPGDYEDAPEIAVASLVPGINPLVPIPQGLLLEGEEISKLLEQRGFQPGRELIAVIRVEGQGENWLAPALVGLYFRICNPFNDRPCYQRVMVADAQLACRGVYIFWSKTQSRWQIGGLDEDKAGYAFCAADTQTPAIPGLQWQSIKRTFFQKEAKQPSTETAETTAAEHTEHMVAATAPEEQQGGAMAEAPPIEMAPSDAMAPDTVADAPALEAADHA